MPSGKTHAIITSTIAGLSLPAILIDPRLLAVTVGIVTGLVVDPDLDLDGWTEAELRLRERSEWLGWAWFVLWWPYARLARHRGLSHAPIVGTAGRAIYLLAPALILQAFLGWLPWWMTAGWFAGLCLADLAHVAADGAVSWFKDWAWERRRKRAVRRIAERTRDG